MLHSVVVGVVILGLFLLRLFFSEQDVLVIQMGFWINFLLEKTLLDMRKKPCLELKKLMDFLEC